MKDIKDIVDWIESNDSDTERQMEILAKGLEKMISEKCRKPGLAWLKEEDPLTREGEMNE